MNSLVIMSLLVAGVSCVPFQGLVGNSGIIRPDGNNVQFSQALADNIAVVGPSGIVTKDGRHIQFTSDLQMLHRSKRHLIGDSGIITRDGIPIQTTRAGVTILLEGPSAYILSDGTLVQKPRAKRSAGLFGHTCGSAGIVTKDGQHFQMAPGVTVVLCGPSGAVLSDGSHIQF